MELVWLVYGLSLLKPIIFLSLSIALIGGVVSLVCWIAVANEEYVHRGFLWFLTLLLAFSILLVVVIPNEKTAYTMIAAYATQKVAERPETQEVAKDVLTIINSKVKQYALESVQELEKASKK